MLLDIYMLCSAFQLITLLCYCIFCINQFVQISGTEPTVTRRVTVETRLKCVTREQENVHTVHTNGQETPAMVRDFEICFQS